MNPRVIKLASPDLLWPWTARVHRHANLLCAFLVVFGIAAWWLWAGNVRPRKTPPLPPAARMVWLSNKPADIEEAWRSDARAISSPVLFALPTPLGFSRGALGRSGFVPPPAPVETNIALRGMPAPTSLVANIARTTPGEAAVSVRSLAWPKNDADTVRAVVSAASPVIVVVCQFAGAAPQTRAISIETNSVWTDALAWEAVASVGLDTQGWPDRVLLEKPPAATNLNARLVQLLSTMNFGSAGAREGRVAIRYDGSGCGPRPIARKAPDEGGAAP